LNIKIINLLIVLLLLPSFAYSLDTISSPDGRWLAIKPTIECNAITIGIIPVDSKIYKFKIIYFFNENRVSEKSYSPPFSASYYERMEYKELNSIWPNFAKLRYFIYIDNEPIVVFEFHTNGSGTINYSFVRWLY
jgi:hypothetical protein